MIKTILGVWLSLCLYSLSFAQTSFKVKGRILDAGTLEPIPGANIKGKEAGTVSDSNGNFVLKNIPKGPHTFTISYVGYESEVLTITVGPGVEDLVIKLKKSMTSLEEVQVLGKTKTREIKESPIVSHTISKDFLEQNRENSLMQTLAKVPGISTINIGSGQSKPVIRGLGFNRVVVVQNGIKHEAQQWGNDHGLEIDQYGIENIQIIKGPASLLYGSDAIAGVVDIQPPAIPPPDSFGGEVNLVGESNNNLLGVSAGLQSRKEAWFYRSRLTLRDYADYNVPTDQINYESYNFDLHGHDLRNTAGQEVNARFSIGYDTENIQSETFFSNVYAKNGFFANAHGLEVRTSEIDYDRSSRDIDLPFHRVNHFKIINNTSISRGHHTFHVDLGYQNNWREEHSEPIPHGYMPKPPDSKERAFTKNTYSLNVRDSFSPTNKHSVVAGINTEIQENTIGGWGFLIPAYNRFTAGLFAYDKFEIHPDLHVQAGLRYDYGLIDTKSYVDWYPSPVTHPDGTTSDTYVQRAQDKTLNFGNISASAGLSYINNNTTYKINLGKSFRMPLPNELASDGVNYHMYRYEKGNLNLDPEESYQMDIAIDHSAPTFHIGISPFLNLFDNYIYLNPTPNYEESLQVYEYTQSKVFRMGGEITAGVTLFDDLTFDASGEYVYSRQTSGAKKGFTLPFSPPLSGVLSAGYRFNDLFVFAQPQIMADYRITAPQNRIVPPEEKTKGYQVLNVSLLANLNLVPSRTPAEIRIKLNNALNTEYYDHTSFYRLIDVPEAARNLSVSITIPF